MEIPVEGCLLFPTISGYKIGNWALFYNILQYEQMTRCSISKAHKNIDGQMEA